MSSYFSGKDDSAVEDLLSQAKDHYVFEQVAKINCAGFSDDSALPSNLKTRLRRLKSLPVSSSSRKHLSHSKSMENYLEKKNRAGKVSSVSDFSIQVGKSCPLDASVEEAQIFSGLKRNLSVNTRGGALGDFHEFGRTGSSSARFSQQGKTLSPTTQITKLLPREKSRMSSSSFTSIDLASPRFEENPRGVLAAGSGRIGSASSTSASQQGKIMTPTTKTLKLLPRTSSQTSIELASPSSSVRPEEGMNKSKSRFLRSWLDKLSLAQAMGCLQGKSTSKSKKTKQSCTEEISWDEEFKKAKKRVAKKNRIEADENNVKNAARF